jgi:membrane protein implicated in regulation of membrane protease activity
VWWIIPALVIATGVWALWMAGWVPEKALTLALWMAAPMLIILCGLATPFMKKPKRPRDPNQLTKLIVDIA